MNVDIFALYIFSRAFKYPRKYVKITCIMPHRGNNIKNANLSRREIPYFPKIAKMYTLENINVHSIYQSASCLIPGRLWGRVMGY